MLVLLHDYMSGRTYEQEINTDADSLAFAILFLYTKF